MRERVFLIVESALCALAAALLAAAAIGIWAEGEAVRSGGDALYWIYTRARAAERFAPIAPVCFGALGLALAGLLLGARGRARGRARPDAALARDIARGRVGTPDAAMRRERALQRRLALAGGLAFGLCMVPVLLCLLNVADPGDAGALFAPVRAFWICAGAGFGVLCALEMPRGSSLRREAAAAAARSRAERADGAPAAGRTALPGAAEQGADAGRTAARVALLILAAALIAAGICNGGLRDVLQKATMICTECIGIG